MLDYVKERVRCWESGVESPVRICEYFAPSWKQFQVHFPALSVVLFSVVKIGLGGLIWAGFGQFGGF